MQVGNRPKFGATPPDLPTDVPSYIRILQQMSARELGTVGPSGSRDSVATARLNEDLFQRTQTTGSAATPGSSQQAARTDTSASTSANTRDTDRTTRTRSRSPKENEKPANRRSRSPRDRDRDNNRPAGPDGKRPWEV